MPRLLPTLSSCWLLAPAPCPHGPPAVAPPRRAPRRAPRRGTRAVALPPLLAGLLLATACGLPGGPRPAPPDASDALIARRPYRAEEIAAAMPVGSWRCDRIEQQEREPLLQRSTVLESGEQRVRLAMQLQTPDEQDIGTPQVLDAGWQELVEHATFPREATTLEDVRLTLPAGTFDCWLYTVTRQEDGVDVVERYHFAKQLAGAPVRYESLHDGLLVYRMTLHARGQR